MLRSFMKCSQPLRHQCNAKNVSLRPGTRQTARCYNFNTSREVTRAGAASLLITARSAVGEWLSLVEHLVRDQGVGGSNPLSPTNFSLALSIVYAAFCTSVFSAIFGTFGTTEGNSKPKRLRSAHSLRN